MVGIRILVHPTCYSSYLLLRHLSTSGYLDRVDVIVAQTPLTAFKYRAWSVPWVLLGDEPVASDPVTPEEIEALIKGEEVPVYRDPVEAFMESVLHSVFASSQLVLWGSIEPMLNKDFVSASTRALLRGLRLNDLVVMLKERSAEIYDKLLEKTIRALSVSYTRELWWGHGGELTDEILVDLARPGVIATWLIAKASIGRIGLPSDPRGKALSIASSISSFIARNSRGLLGKIEREQGEILGDRDYWAMIQRLRHE